MNFHSKKVTLAELDMYKIASDANCAPKLLKVTECENHYMMITDLYPETLTDLIKNKNQELPECLQKVHQLLNILHENDVLHGDISEDNICYNAATKDVKIIDYGMSKRISSIKNIDINEYQELYYEGVKYAGEPSEDITYILKLEHGCVDFLLNSI